LLISRALNILFVTALSSLISTLPFFGPENIFILTGSRLQAPTDVLFNRLAARRGQDLLPSDEIMKSKFVSLESRLLYLTFGPDVLTGCQFCKSDDPRSYLYYALPSLLQPHLLHIAILGAITSSLLFGCKAGIWRTQATIAGLALAVAEIYLVGTYDHKQNARALRLGDIDNFYWRMRFYRGVAIAAVDALLGWGMYLSSTNRAFVTPPSTAERLEATTKVLETIHSKLRAMGIVRNTVMRDDDLRAKNEKYWVTEGKIMREVFEEREVINGVNGALTRINIQTITEEAGKYAEKVIGGLQIVPEATAA
jgi:hypothetical protein